MSKIVQLSEPIQAHGETVAELTFVTPRMKHLKRMDSVQGEIAKICALISELANIPLKAVDEIPAADLTKIQEIFADFLPKSPETGETSMEA